MRTTQSKMDAEMSKEHGKDGSEHKIGREENLPFSISGNEHCWEKYLNQKNTAKDKFFVSPLKSLSAVGKICKAVDAKYLDVSMKIKMTCNLDDIEKEEEIEWKSNSACSVKEYCIDEFHQFDVIQDVAASGTHKKAVQTEPFIQSMTEELEILPPRRSVQVSDLDVTSYSYSMTQLPAEDVSRRNFKCGADQFSLDKEPEAEENLEQDVTVAVEAHKQSVPNSCAELDLLLTADMICSKPMVLHEYTKMPRKKHPDRKEKSQLLGEFLSPFECKERFRHMFSLRCSHVEQSIIMPLFGSHVCGDVTSEGARLQTFLAYPRASHHSALRLANAGFFFTGHGDSLECYSCGATFAYTEENQREDPYALHRRLSPNCRHLNGQDQRNVFVQDDQTQALSSQDITGQDTVGTLPGNPEVREIVSAGREGLRELRGQLASLGIYIQPLLARDTPSQAGSQAGERNAPPLMNGTSQGGSLPPVDVNPSVEPGSGESTSMATLSSEPLRDPRQDSSPPTNTTAAASAAAAASILGNAATPPHPGGLQQPAAGADYDVSQAVYSNYADLNRRLASFATWPETHAQSPEDLARCGFFFTGHGDCVRCHYCGLGLKHWDPEDKPLDEHVRWRSSCAYLRTLCGEDAIARLLAQLGRRQRDDTGGNSGENAEHGRTGGRQNEVVVARAVVAASQTGEPGPALVSSTPARPADSSPTAASFMTSPAAQAAREMGFSDDLIREAIVALMATRAGARAVTPQNVVHAILYIRERGQEGEGGTEGEDWTAGWDNDNDEDSGDETPTDPAPEATGNDETTSPTSTAAELPPPGGEVTGAATRGGSEDSTSNRPVEGSTSSTADRTTRRAGDARQVVQQLEEENQELRERRRCKICLDNAISILFLPCGHLVCCPECAAALLRCPMCRVRIRGRVRTQMASVPQQQQQRNNNNNRN